VPEQQIAGIDDCKGPRRWRGLAEIARRRVQRRGDAIRYRDTPMFPLNVVVIGCEGDLLQMLRLELAVHTARIEAEFLGVESVISGLRAAPIGDPTRETPLQGKKDALIEAPRRLFIVHLDSAQEMPSIKRLSSFFPGNPILVLMDTAGDPNLPITAMRMGANQFVPLPWRADDLKQAIDCIASQHGHSVNNQVIAVAGVTGGSGATTIAINVAFELATLHPLRVVLAELSLQVGKLPLYLNVEPRYTTHDLLRDIHRLDLYSIQQALTPIVDRFHILAGPYHSVSPLTVPPGDVLLLIECLRQLADIVVLDVPCTYDALYFDTLNASDQVVLVGEQKVPSVRSLQMVHNSLADKSHYLLLNRYDPNLPGFGVDRLKTMLRVNEVMTIASDYARVSSSINQGLPLRLKEPKCPALADINAVAKKLVPLEDPAHAKGQGAGVLGGLIRKLGIKK
jgi:pilus assembly protein CpaE